MDLFHVDVQHRENILWKRKLEFWKDELRFYCEKVSEIARSDGSRTSKRILVRLKEIDKERQRILKVINRSEKQLSEDARNSKNLSKDHEGLRFSVQSLEKNYDWIVKHELKKLLTHLRK